MTLETVVGVLAYTSTVTRGLSGVQCTQLVTIRYSVLRVARSVVCVYTSRDRGYAVDVMSEKPEGSIIHLSEIAPAPPETL